MPLRDHFRPPVDNVASWEELHGGWPMVIVQHLNQKLPPGYVAAPRVHLGAQAEIDVAAFEKDDAPSIGGMREANGGVATAVWAPPAASLAIETEVPDFDEYEVRIYDAQRGRTLVATIEIVSPANKDRPEHRNAFVGKCAALLQKGVAVSIVDLVTVRHFNLCAEVLAFVDGLELFEIGYSWGGVTSLAVAYDFHGSKGRPDYGHRIVRLNIGLEDTEDLIEDLERNLANCRGSG